MVKTKLSIPQTSDLPSPLVQPLDNNNRLVNLISEVTNKSIKSVKQQTAELETIAAAVHEIIRCEI